LPFYKCQFNENSPENEDFSGIAPSCSPIDLNFSRMQVFPLVSDDHVAFETNEKPEIDLSPGVQDKTKNSSS
jgi:hypothetical protein